MPDRSATLQKNFGDTMRDERMARHLTHEALAEKSGLSVNFISNLERGTQMPSLESIVRVAEAMKMSGGELLSRAKL